MRAPQRFRTASPVVLAVLLPLIVLSLVVAQLLVLAASPAQALPQGPHAGAEVPFVKAVGAAAQHETAGSRECDPPGTVSGAPRGRDRHRAGARAPLSPAAARPSCATGQAGTRPGAGSGPSSSRPARPDTAHTPAALQVFRC
ncbi:hypothetical protein ACFPM3_04735 [Streptomyces coeruleoprunus]|uniref:Secreted protein n=1 Tax=Streptomyces coeruleoprunus TaxID=285563 RepID=A0ABV9X8W7_9ACTN